MGNYNRIHLVSSRARADAGLAIPLFEMSDSQNPNAAPSGQPVAKKQKVGDKESTASPVSNALLLSSFGFGSAGVKAHMEDAHVMFDEYVQPPKTFVLPIVPCFLRFRIILAAYGRCSRRACSRRRPTHAASTECLTAMCMPSLPPPRPLAASRMLFIRVR